ncbi:MAG TPA: A24 family peptidase [Acidimicrobiales bacterium]|nr:A24 family peptidase [Acidimicrobiales bacterium]
MDALVTGVSAAGGLLIGDRLEIVVERVGARQPLTRPWWTCPLCEQPLGGLSWLPFGELAGRRRCPHCAERAPYAERPLVLAAVSAAVLGLFAARFGADVALAAFAVLGLALVAISAVDLERFVIPNHIVYPTAAAVAPLLVVASGVDGRWGSLARAAIAAAAAFVAFLAVHLLVPKGMGFGDVRLAALVGGASGWLGLGHAFLTFFAAFVLGAAVGLAVMAVGRGGRKTRIPFGPFMAVGMVISVVWGNPLVHALFHRSL